MNPAQLESIVDEVLKRFKDQAVKAGSSDTARSGTACSGTARSGTACSGTACSDTVASQDSEPSSPAMMIPLEVSARHVHLTQQAIEILFGQDARLINKRNLSQPGEFLSEQRLKLITAKGVIDNVAVLGPARSAIQCELSLSDCRALGLNAPLNQSGDLNGAADIIMVGSHGVLEAKGSVIVAKAHIHLTPCLAQKLGLDNGEQVMVDIKSKRPITINDVLIRVSDKFAAAMHIDFDEANACGYDQNSIIRIRGKNMAEQSKPPQQAMAAIAAAMPTAALTKKRVDQPKVITEAIALQIIKGFSGNAIEFAQGTIITPSAKDIFNAKKISFVIA